MDTPLYRVRIDRQGAVHVSLELHELGAVREVRLEVSNWVAGAYAFLRYGRDLYAVDAMSGDGSRLQVLRDGLSSFRVIAPGDGTFSSVFFNATVQARDLTSLEKIAAENDRWQLAVIGKNLTNKFYFIGGGTAPLTGAGRRSNAARDRSSSRVRLGSPVIASCSASCSRTIWTSRFARDTRNEKNPLEWTPSVLLMTTKGRESQHVSPSLISASLVCVPSCRSRG